MLRIHFRITKTLSFLFLHLRGNDETRLTMRSLVVQMADNVAPAKRAGRPTPKGAKVLKYRSRGWCFTIQVQDEGANLLTTPVPGVDYQVWQYETAPETGQIHIQGYLYNSNPITGSAIKKRLYEWSGVQPHLEPPRGSPEQNKTYCTKEETRFAGPYEFGSAWHFHTSLQDLLNGNQIADLLCAVVYVSSEFVL